MEKPTERKDVRFEIFGFDEPSSFVPFVQSVTRRLHDQAPAETKTTASFVRCGDLISGAITLCTPVGVLSSRGQGRNGHLIARSIAKELSRQLKKLAVRREIPSGNQGLIRGHLRLIPGLA